MDHTDFTVRGVQVRLGGFFFRDGFHALLTSIANLVTVIEISRIVCLVLLIDCSAYDRLGWRGAWLDSLDCWSQCIAVFRTKIATRSAEDFI